MVTRHIPDCFFVITLSERRPLPITLPATPNRTALYCRLSKDDEQIGESTSIETQRIMLTRFCKENQLAIVDYYVDDGFSGLSYDRPDFLRLIDDIEAGLIDLV